MPQYRHRRGRGRGRGRRWVNGYPTANMYSPHGVPPDTTGTVVLTLEEFEALRLVDGVGLEQQEAAFQMGVSRKTLWIDLKRARKKVATALTNGWVIRIEGGNYRIRGEMI